MPAAITDLLTQATNNSRPSPTTVSATRAGGGTTLQLLSLAGWPTATAVHFITYKVNTSGQKLAGTQIDWKGVVSGTTITNLVIKAGNDTGNAINDIVEAAPTAAWPNDVVAWGIVHANQDGSLKPIALNQATAGVPSTITAAGADPNIHLNLISKGTGEVLLNGVGISGAWGAWTPTVTAATGAFTTTTLGSATYKQFGKTVFFHLDLTITTVGTAAGAIIVTLPTTPVAGKVPIFYGREDAISGKMLQAKTISNTANILVYDNTSAIVAAAVIRLDGTYETS